MKNNDNPILKKTTICITATAVSNDDVCCHLFACTFLSSYKTRIKKILFTRERKQIIYAQMHLQYFNEY